jgi:hypothetical protein
MTKVQELSARVKHVTYNQLNYKTLAQDIPDGDSTLHNRNPQIPINLQPLDDVTKQ